MYIDYIVFFGLILVGIIVVMIAPKRSTTINYELKKTESPIERKLYRALYLNGYNVITQYRIGPYRADLYLPAYQLVIECDGKQWHGPDRKRCHRKRDNFMQSRSYQVIRFTGSEINRN
ncbi:endonuclease domain-containing protein [Calidifontibacillus erzurumensis]|uniref:DUF559 domain-containing protein n=1 Tax=Calidifontibacillus erzurumensis TaxID=2741433 RepID=A0A8J8GAM2_9BACI|nr:DUF559 domain-containing protein [Calidifontibacillus erzurumensis]NSL50400.1 DUF559 domain-containing protein [Calidifontibacillus erzurumensis]